MSRSAPITLSRPFSASKSASDFGALDHECTVFSYYLVNQKPSEYVLEKYREAHARSHFVHGLATNHWDRFLLSISTKHPALTKLVDAYTSIFFKRSTVRKKWILLLAILESCAPTYHYFDYPETDNKKIAFIKMFWNGGVFLLALCLSIILFMPLHLIFAASAKLLRYE